MLASRKLVLLIFPLTLLGGCGTDSSSDSTFLDEVKANNPSLAESALLRSKIEEMIAKCMAERGWEYRPLPQPSLPPSAAEDKTSPDYTRSYGYGVVHTYELDVLPYLASDGSVVEGHEAEMIDPNFAYVNSLPVALQSKFYEDLYGEPSGASDAPPLDSTSCSFVGESSLQVPPGGERLEAASRRYVQLEREARDDSRLAAFGRAWSECLAKVDNRWTFKRTDDPAIYVEMQLARLRGLDVVPADQETGLPLDSRYSQEGSEGNVGPDGQYYAYSGRQRIPTERGLTSLAEEERRLFKADHDCRRASGYKEVEDRLIAEIDRRISDEFGL